ncbi:hypothetical protein SASPL_126141 [Salvia splendens]|uniref:Uncharacterized protein n=1 Tax=Salvia splendens TaxID=180675 RepID=A0A8X8ZPS2_SALSN|nr:hypothetical protein SASPL_126141 [Salvia splendens]
MLKLSLLRLWIEIKRLIAIIQDADEVIRVVPCALNQREKLDKGFPAEVNAQLGARKEDEDKPGLEAMLHKFLQLYASRVFFKPRNEVLEPEKFSEPLIQAKFQLLLLHLLGHVEIRA